MPVYEVDVLSAVTAIGVTATESERSTLATEHFALATSHSLLATDLAAKSTLLDVLTKGRIAQDEQMEK